jgi:hypothetical protein
MCGATDPANHQALALGGYPHAEVSRRSR